MGCNGIIHSILSLVRIGFVSSAYFGKDLKLLGVSLVRKNYQNVGIKSMVIFNNMRGTYDFLAFEPILDFARFREFLLNFSSASNA